MTIRCGKKMYKMTRQSRVGYLNSKIVRESLSSPYYYFLSTADLHEVSFEPLIKSTLDSEWFPKNYRFRKWVSVHESLASLDVDSLSWVYAGLANV